MKKMFFLLILALSVMSCKDDFSISSLPDTPSKLVVYCMPSTADTTYVTVSHSIPLKTYETAHKNPMIDDANITYQLNGQAQPVTALGNGRYRVVAHQKAGDKVQLRVEAQGLESVESSTEIPEPVEVNNLSVRKVGSKYGVMRQQLLATFTDPAQTRDYYAVRVKRAELQSCYVEGYRRYGSDMKMVKLYYRYRDYMEQRDSEQWDSVAVHYSISESYMPLYIENEPLLNPLSGIDDDFGFSNDYYQDFYIFEDKTINGTAYTLHLNVKVESRRWYGYESKEALKELKEKYGVEEGLKLELYHIAPSYYRFLLTLNELSNNAFSQAGLSPVRPTYSNMRNGMGVCAGYNLPKPAVVPWEKIE